MSARIRHPGWLAAALIALLTLSYASVRSTVMQVAMATPVFVMPMCDGGLSSSVTAMGSEAHASRSRVHGSAPASGKACPYCATAAHPPLVSQTAPLLTFTAVKFVAYRIVSLHGARGPPSRRPRARDPPVLFLSV